MSANQLSGMVQICIVGTKRVVRSQERFVIIHDKHISQVMLTELKFFTHTTDLELARSVGIGSVLCVCEWFERNRSLHWVPRLLAASGFAV